MRRCRHRRWGRVDGRGLPGLAVCVGRRVTEPAVDPAQAAAKAEADRVAAEKAAADKAAADKIDADKAAAAAAEAALTPSQRNAARQAKSYLEFSAFSRTGLIQQLEFEGFPNADSAYGADKTGADWNEQAALKAKSYLEFKGFSRSSLIEQLTFDGFTKAEATYGVEQAGL